MAFVMTMIGALMLLDGFDGHGKTIDQRHQYEIIAGLVVLGFGALMFIIRGDE